MLKRLTMLLAGLFLMTGVALAQSTVSGTVYDNNGEPIGSSSESGRHEDRHCY